MSTNGLMPLDAPKYADRDITLLRMFTATALYVLNAFNTWSYFNAAGELSLSMHLFNVE